MSESNSCKAYFGRCEDCQKLFIRRGSALLCLLRKSEPVDFTERLYGTVGLYPKKQGKHSY